MTEEQAQSGPARVPEHDADTGGVSAEKMFEYLVESFGASPHEAKLLMEQDADLWIVSPTGRFAAEGEEAVEAWSEAVRVLNSLQEMASSGALCGGRAVMMCIWDAGERAKIALERARQRMTEAVG